MNDPCWISRFYCRNEKGKREEERLIETINIEEIYGEYLYE
jgi:hypothetical protein